MTETPTALATKMGSIIGHRIDYNAGAYAGGVHWVHVHPPPPTWEKSSTQKLKSPKEKRKFRPDMSAKKNVHVPLRYDKIKTKKVGKKEKSKRKGIKLKKERKKERG